MALGLTQPLTEMSTRSIFWGVKVTGAYVFKSGSLNILKPSGTVQFCNGTALPLIERVICLLKFEQNVYQHNFIV